jgi:hypothetical protein
MNIVPICLIIVYDLTILSLACVLVGSLGIRVADAIRISKRRGWAKI